MIRPRRLPAGTPLAIALAGLAVGGCATGSTLPARDVTDAAATLAATGNAHGKATQYWFEWGPTTTYGSTTPRTDAPSDSVEHTVAARVGALQPGRTYHYRAAAQSPGEGVVRGADRAFTTPPAGSQLLPDLVQDVPAEIGVSQAGAAYRLGFRSSVQNHGQGPLVVRGHRSAPTDPMIADQAISIAGSGATSTVPAVGRMEFNDAHWHWHYLGFDRYELRRSGDDALVAPDRKTGFCLGDRFNLDFPYAIGPFTYSDCKPGDTQALSVDEGISVGYGDDYPPQLEGQYIDVTGVAPGTYTLVFRANADGALRESDYANNVASAAIALWPGGVGAAPAVSVLRSCPGTDRCPPAASLAAAPAARTASLTAPASAAPAAASVPPRIHRLVPARWLCSLHERRGRKLR